jgi:hypothetical protein
MTDAVIIALTGFLNIVCFVIGAKVGQAVSKYEKVEMPNLNPFKAIRESQARKAAQAEEDRKNTILQNIERYDGTGKGQKDVK